ncbi:glucosylglycerol hydrolase [Cyanobacterium aponinum AL20118]
MIEIHPEIKTMGIEDKKEENKLVYLVEEETQKLIKWVKNIEKSDDLTIFEKNQEIVTRLGAHYRSDGLTEIGFWTPKLMREVLHPKDIYLEIFTPLEKIDWRKPSQNIKFRRDCVCLERYDIYFWGVISGLQAGTRDNAGSFYWLRYVTPSGRVEIIRDVMAYSLPYGIFAPAELYDIDSLQKERADIDYFKHTGTIRDKKIPRVSEPRHILQLHVGTATQEGTFEGLTHLYRTIGDKIRKNQTLSPYEQNYVGYDAIQLLPVEPTIEYRRDFSNHSTMFHITTDVNGLDRDLSHEPIVVKLSKPNTQNWGYDVPILGSNATNPSFLGTLRPDELFDFIGVLHNFPEKPIKLIYDLVYGHADNQGELLVNRLFFKGPNMYGQDLNHQSPMVRALLLEMQRRKINTGADGIRIDGGQDFRFFNPLSGRVEYDDQYLLAMSDVVQEVEGYKRRLFTIFEDGRPWPEEGWEEKSTYLDLIKLKSESYQWGPLIFAHNTPALKGFWDRKWSRVCEVMTQGQNWITGCGNHDTFRRGNQIPLDSDVNEYLGDSLNEIIYNAYDNPAVALWVYGFSPGLPMDFINVLMHTPWMFFRNTDEEYGVKVVCEEVGFLDWRITEQLYQRDDVFTRMKSWGFRELHQLKEFTHTLNSTMIAKDYDLEEVILACQSCFKEVDGAYCDLETLKFLKQAEMIDFLQSLDSDRLKQWANMFMEDCYQVCNVSHYFEKVDPAYTQFNLSLRHFRSQHNWLHNNIQGSDRFNRISEDGATIFYGIRNNPDNTDEKLALVVNLEGKSREINLLDWLQLDVDEWEIVFTTPNLSPPDDIKDLNCFPLAQSQGFLLKSKKQEISNK